MSLQFSVKHTWNDNKTEHWKGQVDTVTKYESHVEFHVQGRGSGFTVIVGEYTSGTFMTLVDHEVSLALADPQDIFYNKEKVLRHESLNHVDGITAIYALKALDDADLLP